MAEAAQIPAMTVLRLPDTGRAKRLRALSSFYEGTQHDHCGASWDGRPRKPGLSYLQERIPPKGLVPTNAITHEDRKPDADYPLGRQIVSSFTDMVLGEGRHPQLRVEADRRTELYLDACMEASDTWDTLIECRDTAGQTGAAAMSLGVDDGEPTAEPHHPADLWVKRWRPGGKWIPAEVVEQRLIEKQVEQKGRLVTVRCWRTRYWNEYVVVHYEDVPEDFGSDAKAGPPPPIPIAMNDDGSLKIVEHGVGRCPVVWLQNTRNAKAPEGRPDYEGVFPLLDKVDRLQSMVVRASIANVDPTLVRKVDENVRKRRQQERKGFGAMIDVGPGGDAKFLETSGASVEMGWNGVHNVRDEVLQTVGCVLITPETAGAYKSGEALQLLWRRMEARCGRIRKPLTDVIRQISAIWLKLGRDLEVSSSEEDNPEGIVLPPLVEKVVEADVEKVTSKPHEVGDGHFIDPQWPPYHTPTATQLQAMATALATATTQKQTLSAETATGTLVRYLGRGDMAEERRRIEEEKAAGVAQFGAAMFDDGDDGDEAADRAAAAEDEANEQGQAGDAGQSED